jgi:anthranilate phosphoribosyltransferase
VEPLAHVLNRLGSHHVLVVHSEDGLDEISISAPTRVAELKAGQISTYELTPERFALARAPLSDICVDSVEASLAMVRSVLEGKPGPARDITVLNAGAALYAADLAESIERGVALAEGALSSGEAAARLDALVALSQQLEGEGK